MPKMFIMQGLPGSGKSSKAKEHYEMEKTKRVNRDLLREMMDFSYYTEETEKEIRYVEQMLVEYFLSCGYDVIVDDSNLKEKTIKEWKAIARNMKAEVETIRMRTPIEECIARDAKREKGRVGEAVIRKMAEYPLAKKLYEEAK